MIGFSVVQFFSISIILTALIYVVVSGNILMYLFIFFSPGHGDQHWGWLRHTISRNIQRSSDCCRDSGSCTGSKVSAHLPSHISYFQEHYNNKCGALLTLVVTQCVTQEHVSYVYAYCLRGGSPQLRDVYFDFLSWLWWLIGSIFFQWCCQCRLVSYLQMVLCYVHPLNTLSSLKNTTLLEVTFPSP